MAAKTNEPRKEGGAQQEEGQVEKPAFPWLEGEWPNRPGNQKAAFAGVVAARKARAWWEAHIKSFKRLRGKTPKEPSERSKADYVAQAMRLLRDNATPAQAWERAADTEKIETWSKRAACLTWFAMQRMQEVLKEQDRMQARGAAAADHPQHQIWLAAVEECTRWASVITARSIQLPLKKVVKRASKRKVGKLPMHWRELIARRMQVWKWEYVTQAVTGCRPEELALGVNLSISDGQLTAVVIGAKLGDDAGQSQRTLRWDLGKPSPLVKVLAEQVKQRGGALRVSLDGRKNPNPRAAYSRAISNAAKREWPSHPVSITAYSLRHAFADDLKDDDQLERPQKSAAMGHQVDRTISGYGQQGRGRGAFSVAPDDVSAEKQVRLRATPASELKKLKRPGVGT